MKGGLKGGYPICMQNVKENTDNNLVCTYFDGIITVV